MLIPAKAGVNASDMQVMDSEIVIMEDGLLLLDLSSKALSSRRISFRLCFHQYFSPQKEDKHFVTEIGWGQQAGDTCVLDATVLSTELVQGSGSRRLETGSCQ